MTVFMTRFPGFLGSALLPRILRRTEGNAIALVQSKFAAVAQRRLAELCAADRPRSTPCPASRRARTRCAACS